MVTAISAGISEMVNSAFDESRCEAEHTEVKHEGKIAALWVGHTCAEQLLCEAHFKCAVDVWIPRHKHTVATIGYIICADCNRKFLTAEEFVTVYPL
ncbi:Uncharacterised protein [Mycobacteroides abscessus subsp. abscessus]|nr:Uncharacterised protein [Mycobacteroides abscessus subsp. abscessus]SKO61383.1 Uncharacterised protein [Mycobacteroides abscessus subsp. abscessus]SLH92059.1 Uncharacterised protein [Mycobacteroides abscessus subsp. massiliense]SLI31061.1 Uncharacterised protein [Mycobacteroides abscessus subsp. massiliense]